MIKALVFGIAAGLVGAAVWTGIGFFSGYEIGFVAWGIGALVGAAVGLGAGAKAGVPTGVVAVVIAVVAVVAGKAGVIGADLARYLGENPPPAVTEENLISYVADEVVDDRQAAGQPVVWSPDVDPNTAWVEADYPADVWAEAETRWAALSDDEKAAYRTIAEERVAYTSEVIGQAFGDALRASFSPFDLLWFGLAVVSAFKLGASSLGGDEPAAAA